MSRSDNNKISIIIPAYNIENYIENCLESLINQTYKNIEIIVVNDGSKDKTLQIINEFAKKDNRIKVINQQNQGVSESRNNALEKVEADYIMFVDGDDWIEKNTCEIVINEIKKENPDILCFAYIREYKNNALKKAVFEEEKSIFKNSEIKDKLHRRLFGLISEELMHPEKLDVLSPVWGKVYKKPLLDGLRFCPLKDIGMTGEDTFFNIDVFEKAKKVVCIKKYLYHYRKENEKSLTKALDEQFIEKRRKSYSKMKRIIEERNYDNSYEIALDNRYAIYLIAIGLKIVKAKVNHKTKLNNVKRTLEDDIYITAIRKLDISKMPIHWKLFFEFAKYRITLLVYFLLLVMNELSSKK